MIPAMIASTVLVVLTTLIHYEVLRFASVHLADIPVPPRARILVVVAAAFTAHTIEVWLYAFAYFLSIEAFDLGGFGGQPLGGFAGSLYFSGVTYTSLGLRAYYPTRALRLVAGVEALNGWLMIGWPAPFTYLAREKSWPLHRTAGERKRAIG